MLASVRAFTKTWFAKGLLILLAIGMAVFGTQGMLQASFSNAAISAGSREISPQEFRTLFEGARKRLGEQRGQPITQDMLISAGYHRQMAQGLAVQEAFAEWLARIHLRPADSLVIDQIRRAPVFFNPITGAFDQTAYQGWLVQQGLTDKKFEQTLRDEIASDHFAKAMVQGLRLPNIYGALVASHTMQTRDVSWFAVTPASITMPEAPTDAQLTAFIRENEAALRRPEFREFTVALFTPRAFAGSVTVPESEVRRVYDFRKDSLSRPETRTFVQITVPNAAAAQRAIAALNGGQDAQTVATSVGGRAVAYQARPLSAVPDRAVGQAAFALQANQVSAPIQGELGLSVVKVETITPATNVTYEQARGEIEASLKQEAAGEKVYEAVQKFEAARQAGKGLVEAAREAGAQVVTLPPVTETGQLPNGQRIQAPEAVFTAGFALPAEHGESDQAEDGGNGEYFAIRVERVRPGGLPAVAEEREPLSRAWMQREVARRMEQLAQTLSERLDKGEPIAAVAAAARAEVRTLKGLTRAPNEALGEQAVAEMFLRKPREAFSVRVPPFAFAVGRVDAVNSPPTAPAARAAAEQRAALTRQSFDEMAELARLYTRNEIEPRIYQERIDQVLGIDPQTSSGSGSGGGAAGGSGGGSGKK